MILETVPNFCYGHHMKAISLYSGAGGFDLGLEAAGIDSAVCVQYEPPTKEGGRPPRQHACETLLANKTAGRNWEVICKSIYDVRSEEILEAGGLKAGEPDVLLGGPPCQPYSKMKNWVQSPGGIEDARSETLGAYMRVLRDTKPKTFVLENVFGMNYKNRNGAMVLLRKLVDDINESTAQVVDLVRQAREAPDQAA